MGKLTEADIEMIKEKAKQIEYGTIEMEFKGGVCMAIVDKGRTLTNRGRELLGKRKK